MIIEVDLIDEVVLLLDGDLAVVDAFRARGATRHEAPSSVRFYTFRGLLIMPGSCAVCGYSLDRIGERCSSSGGFHAFTGVDDNSDVPEGHKAGNRSLTLHALTYDELVFYVVPDNLFPIDDAASSLIV